MRRRALALGLGGITAGAGLVWAGWQAQDPPPAPLPAVTFDLGAQEGARPANGAGVRAVADDTTSRESGPWPSPGPNRVVVPSLGVDAPVWGAPLDGEGELVVPGDPNHIGRWTGGAPATSRVGTTLLAGHVDSSGRLGALHPLSQVRPGARVVTTDATGQATRWRVRALTVRAKDDVPAFPATGARRLVLVTCGGEVVDTPHGHSYVSNVIATAVPATS